MLSLYTQQRGDSITDQALVRPLCRRFQDTDSGSEKDAKILELRETNELLDSKVKKLEQLVRLKESKIQALTAKLQQAGLA